MGYIVVFPRPLLQDCDALSVVGEPWLDVLILVLFSECEPSLSHILFSIFFFVSDMRTLWH